MGSSKKFEVETQTVRPLDDASQKWERIDDNLS